MATPTPVSGQLALTDIKNAFPNINSNAVGDYRNVQWYRPDNSANGVFSAGTIQYSDFYNKVYTVVPTIADQSFSLGSQYPCCGCAGAGWTGMVLYIVSSVIWLSTTGQYSDYGYYPGYRTAAMMGPWPASSTSILWSPIGQAGRDNMTFNISATVSGNTLVLGVRPDCKGGWGTSAYRTANVPIVWVSP
jgi:hypothetical protein